MSSPTGLDLRDPKEEQREPGRKGGLAQGLRVPQSPQRIPDGSVGRIKELVGVNMLHKL